jgi:peptidoglycan/LPS O-acetylase OafA/YrhL
MGNGGQIARLTYGWYLVHPMWISQNFGALQKPLPYTDYTIATYYTMNAVVSLAFSVCLFFLVEKPMMTVKALAQKKIVARCRRRRV